MSTLEGFSDNAFIEKPASGWLHDDKDLIDGNAITYTIQVGWRSKGQEGVRCDQVACTSSPLRSM